MIIGDIDERIERQARKRDQLLERLVEPPLVPEQIDTLRKRWNRWCLKRETCRFQDPNDSLKTSTRH